MMKNIILPLLFLTLSFSACSQKDHAKMEKIKALKVAHLSDKLNLTELEADKFWPIYNAYDDKRHKLFKLERRLVKDNIKKVGGIESLTNEEADAVLLKLRDVKEQLHSNRLEFQKSILNILPSKKILLLEVTERNFNRKLMKMLKKERLEKDQN